MGTSFQAYTNEGILQGELPDGVRLGELLETEAEISLQQVRWQPYQARSVEQRPDSAISTEDLLLVVAPPETVTPVHPAWNPVTLLLSPYVVEAELPTLPGFDPGRALARPSGQFVLVGHVRVRTLGSSDDSRDEHTFAWVNRYAVERIDSALELPFFFPGAVQEPRQDANPPQTMPPSAA
jgi:hypothetical protein